MFSCHLFTIFPLYVCIHGFVMCLSSESYNKMNKDCCKPLIFMLLSWDFFFQEFKESCKISRSNKLFSLLTFFLSKFVDKKNIGVFARCIIAGAGVFTQCITFTSKVI